ncbi:hypothetical protein [Clostridium massiliamazoniense]|uniref:hypothetical protein n=1 Tax=Clostridium massiliamazoniense TaxID=1347366 RepID=UPI0006D7FB3E|nr:hypothetical protein [Clostridium massiliamazoniense]
MKIEGLKELFLKAEKVSELVKVSSDENMIKVSANSGNIYYTAGVANEEKEVTEFILDKNSINLLKAIEVGEVASVTVKGNKIEIKGGSTKATLVQLEDTVKEVSFESQAMARFDISNIKKVLYTCAVNSPHAILNGISFKTVCGDVEVVTCDGIRTAITTIPLNQVPNMEMLADGLEFVISKNDITKILSIMQGEICLLYDKEKNVATFLQENNMISVNCLTEKYISYNKILTNIQTPNYILVDKDALYKNINRCALAGNLKVSLDMSKVEVDVISKSETIEIVDTVKIAESNLNENIKIDFNLKYLNDMISSIRSEVEEDEIRLEFNSPLLPIRFISEDTQHLLLPVADKKKIEK